MIPSCAWGGSHGPQRHGGWPETIANSLMNWRHDRQAYPFNAHPSATHRSPPCRLPPSPACPRHSNRKPRANGAHATYGTACQGDVTAKPARHLVRVGEQLQGEVRGGDRALEALRTARETASPGASQTNKSPVHGPGSFVQWHALRRALAARAAETRRGAPACGRRTHLQGQASSPCPRDAGALPGPSDPGRQPAWHSSQARARRRLPTHCPVPHPRRYSCCSPESTRYCWHWWQQS